MENRRLPIARGADLGIEPLGLVECQTFNLLGHRLFRELSFFSPKLFLGGSLGRYHLAPAYPSP